MCRERGGCASLRRLFTPVRYAITSWVADRLIEVLSHDEVSTSRFTSFGIMSSRFRCPLEVAKAVPVVICHMATNTLKVVCRNFEPLRVANIEVSADP